MSYYSSKCLTCASWVGTWGHPDNIEAGKHKTARCTNKGSPHYYNDDILSANDGCQLWGGSASFYYENVVERIEREARVRMECVELRKQSIKICIEKLHNDPNSAWAYYHLYEAYKAAGKTIEAISALERAVQLEPNNGTYSSTLASEKKEVEANALKAKEAAEARALEKRIKMKRNIITAICAVAIVLVIISFIVYRSTGSFFNYQNNAQGTLTLTGYSGKKEVVIPATNKGISVTEIGNKAFYKKKLTSVIIPDGITAIGDNAFYGNRLTSVVIPDSVITIGVSAFSNNFDKKGYPTYGGNSLTSTNIPDGVTFIGRSAFAGNRLTSITIPDGVTSIERSVFFGNPLTSVVIPNSVTTIERTAFFGNRLTSVVIPNSVTSIGEDSFTGHQLTSITIGANVTLDAVVGSFGEEGFVSNYNNGGKRAGTYTRPNTKSKSWTRK
jgi:hypothetical protein